MGNTRYLINKNEHEFNYDLIYISKSKFENDWHSTYHFHPFTEIFFITDGKGAFYVDDDIVKVNKWDLVIINPNCLHTEKSSYLDTPLEYFVLGIDNLLLNLPKSPTLVTNMDKADLYKTLNLSSQKDVMLSYFNRLIDEIENKKLNYQLACKSILMLFLTDILRINATLNFVEKSNDKINLECLKIKNYIDAHYSQNITLDYLASMSYMNKYHLVHTFKKQIGISPINYVIKKRIDESKNLLETTSYSVRDISAIAGFANSSYFSQIFKKTTGVSPKEYRINTQDLRRKDNRNLEKPFDIPLEEYVDKDMDSKNNSKELTYN
ncbi:AraC family transcriptional regulator [Clostridium sp.]|uniref:AraC family transcriptional regulator n=1 Tax=Clostridium sp. TaxID=1506 RepID=UPI00261A6003|nr:AraC family transcriptional regulator [Clostridium sp.]